MPIINTNVGAGLRESDRFQLGVSNVDPGTVVEKDVLLPWPSNPRVSWIYYDVAVGVMLDSGMAVHNLLPQADGDPDTLAVCDIDDPRLDAIETGGVNLKCRDQYEDVIQRMGHARYWFRLWGQALRVGKQVPIPGLKKVGGVDAVPYDKNPQWAFNRIAPGGNFGGTVLWHAAWSLWYTTLVPPTSSYLPSVDLMAKVSSRGTGPDRRGIQSPFSQPDDNAVQEQQLNLNTVQ